MRSDEAEGLLELRLSAHHSQKVQRLRRTTIHARRLERLCSGGERFFANLHRSSEEFPANLGECALLGVLARVRGQGTPHVHEVVATLNVRIVHADVDNRDDARELLAAVVRWEELEFALARVDLLEEGVDELLIPLLIVREQGDRRLAPLARFEVLLELVDVCKAIGDARLVVGVCGVGDAQVEAGAKVQLAQRLRDLSARNRAV